MKEEKIQKYHSWKTTDFITQEGMEKWVWVILSYAEFTVPKKFRQFKPPLSWFMISDMWQNYYTSDHNAAVPIFYSCLYYLIFRHSWVSSTSSWLIRCMLGLGRCSRWRTRPQSPPLSRTPPSSSTLPGRQRSMRTLNWHRNITRRYGILKWVCIIIVGNAYIMKTLNKKNRLSWRFVDHRSHNKLCFKGQSRS